MSVLTLVDFAFIDIKHMDSNQHREKTAVGNEIILDNISILLKSAWRGRLVLRMPVIRGYNDDISHAKTVASFMEANGLVELNLLPFHRMGQSKWEQLGKCYPYAWELPTPPETLQALQQFYLDRRIACYLGDEVLY